MKCNKCGKDNTKDSIFCKSCGARLEIEIKVNNQLKAPKWYWIVHLIVPLLMLIPLIIYSFRGPTEFELIGMEILFSVLFTVYNLIFLIYLFAKQYSRSSKIIPWIYLVLMCSWVLAYNLQSYNLQSGVNIDPFFISFVVIYAILSVCFSLYNLWKE